MVQLNGEWRASLAGSGAAVGERSVGGPTDEAERYAQPLSHRLRLSGGLEVRPSTDPAVEFGDGAPVDAKDACAVHLMHNAGRA